jgi:hypothetical protein
MPLEDWVQHWAVAKFLYDWQTLIAGVFAVGAAVVTIWATIRSANREIFASRAQTAVAQKQIETTLRLERRRAAREGYAFCAMLNAAMSRVIAEVVEMTGRLATREQMLAFATLPKFTKSAFPEIRSACVSYGGLLTAEFLDLEGEIEQFASQCTNLQARFNHEHIPDAERERLLDKLRVIQVKAAHLREEGTTGMQRADAVIVETETPLSDRGGKAS